MQQFRTPVHLLETVSLMSSDRHNSGTLLVFLKLYVHISSRKHMAARSIVFIGVHLQPTEILYDLICTEMLMFILCFLNAG